MTISFNVPARCFRPILGPAPSRQTITPPILNSIKVFRIVFLFPKPVVIIMWSTNYSLIPNPYNNGRRLLFDIDLPIGIQTKVFIIRVLTSQSPPLLLFLQQNNLRPSHLYINVTGCYHRGNESYSQYNGIDLIVLGLLNEQDANIYDNYLLGKCEECGNGEVPEFDVAG